MIKLNFKENVETEQEIVFLDKDGNKKITITDLAQMKLMLVGLMQ